MRKHFKIISILLFITLPILYLGISKNNLFFGSLSRGSYFFEKTRNAPNINKIVMVFPNDWTITLNKTNDLWRVKEADDYFASLPKIKSLINVLRNTIVYRTDYIDKENKIFTKDNTIKIMTYSNNKIIDDAFVAIKNEKNKNHYAMLNNDNKLYQISENFHFFANYMDWVHSPVLVINKNAIKSIFTDNFEVYRSFDGEDFLSDNEDDNIQSIALLIKHFEFINAIDIKHSIHFDYKKLKKIKHYTISLFSGGIYNIYIYSDGNEFWLNIKPDREKIAKESVVTWLNENSILYDGWFFKIDKSIGIVISNFSI